MSKWERKKRKDKRESERERLRATAEGLKVQIGRVGEWGTRIPSVSLFAKYTFPLLDGIFTPKLLLPYRNVGQQQIAVIIYSENVQLWHSFLAKGGTSNTFGKW
jgi:hypothetical protein